MERIYELADNLLAKMLKEPEKGYSEDDIVRISGCTEKEIKSIKAVLLNGGYVQFPRNKETGKSDGGELYLTNSGGNFILSGGFAEQIKREKRMTENIEASIRVANVSEKVATLQKKVSIGTLIIAILTLIVLLFQFLAAIGIFNKPIPVSSKSVNNKEIIKDSVCAFNCELRRTFHFNQFIN
jgi:hypothetical protein